MKYRSILFDLDGTLIESAPGIFSVAKAVLAEMGLPVKSDDEMLKMIGPPLRRCFTDILEVPEERADEAVERYHSLAKHIGLDEIKAYSGILELLNDLAAAGAKMYVVTSKVTPTAKSHIERYGLSPYIDEVWGGIVGGSADKTLILSTALEHIGVTGEPFVMVGDRHYDFDAAEKLGVDSIGVLYGYGSREEIFACNPTIIAETVEELRSILLK